MLGLVDVSKDHLEAQIVPFYLQCFLCAGAR